MGVIIAKDLAIGYNNTPLYRDINVTINCGERLALVGVNGAGKSTLLKTFAGLLSPCHGFLEVLGKPAGESPKDVAYLSQFHPKKNLLPLTVYEFVMMGRYAHLGLMRHVSDYDKMLVDEALGFMEIGYLRHTMLSQLSGGERQRVFLSYIYVHSAHVVLLDEPTSNLDVKGIEIYRKFIDYLSQKGTMVVIATHDINEARSCDKTMLFSHQGIVYGEAQTILTQERLLEIFGLRV